MTQYEFFKEIATLGDMYIKLCKLDLTRTGELQQPSAKEAYLELSIKPELEAMGNEPDIQLLFVYKSITSLIEQEKELVKSLPLVYRKYLSKLILNIDTDLKMVLSNENYEGYVEEDHDDDLKELNKEKKGIDSILNC